MPYSTLTQLKAHMSVDEIIQCSDDYGTGEIDDKVITDRIAKADAFIDGFLRGRYPAEIPDAEVPDLISDISTKLTAYYLYARRIRLTMPDTLKDDYKYCMKMLEGIQSGKITPFPESAEPGVIITNKTALSRCYSTDVWSMYN